MTYTERLLALIDHFSTATGMTREQVSYQIFRDQRRLGRVADGKASITVRSFDGALAWLSGNWPDDTAWPDFIERPALVEAAQ